MHKGNDMNDFEIQSYLLDSTGFVHLRQIIHVDQIAMAYNEAMAIQQRMFGNTKVRKFGVLDESEQPQIFLKLLMSPLLRKLLAYALGPFYRLDSAFGLNQPYDGGTGENLHGGPGSGHGMHNYARQAGKTVCGQISVGITLQQPGEGGFTFLPGSHKSDYPIEGGAVLYQLKQHQMTNRLERPHLNTGDIILFPETLVHGASMVNSPRLSLYFMFTAGHVCYRLEQFNERTKRTAEELGLCGMINSAYVSGRDKYESMEVRKSPTAVESVRYI